MIKGINEKKTIYNHLLKYSKEAPGPAASGSGSWEFVDITNSQSPSEVFRDLLNQNL